MKLNGALQLLACADGFTVLGGNMYENTKALLVASKKFNLNVLIKQMLRPC